jgi:hypothetical protein
MNEIPVITLCRIGSLSTGTTMQQKTNSAEAMKRGLATSDDVARILGNLDPSKMLPIIELRPTVLDVEEASMWLAGDRDVFGPGPPLQGIPGQIVAILTADEEEAAEEEPPELG